jgi:uncharacterized RDD family membrane protein YckC
VKATERVDSPYPKADLTLRILARFVDFLFAVAAARLLPPLGPIVAAGYLLLADGLGQGQSIGKRIFGVRAVVPSRRAPAGLRESVLRNAPFGLVMVFAAVPLLWPVLLVAGVPIVAFETWQVWDDRLGIRIGDFFADTQVIDTKVFTEDAERALATRLGQVVAPPPAPRPTANAHRGEVAPSPRA